MTVHYSVQNNPLLTMSSHLTD